VAHDGHGDHFHGLLALGVLSEPTWQNRSGIGWQANGYGLIPSCVQTSNYAWSSSRSLRLHRRDACATDYYLYDGNMV
jgi:hypothetical protein